MYLPFNLTFYLAITAKLRQNWRKEAQQLPVPARLAAFTLIELSIVLVIIGLIVGGVLVGQDLIRATELRSVVSDINQFETARMTFKLRYNCLPGDCKTAASLGIGSDGNGNKMISAPPADYESWQFWVQLRNADLVSGEYTGVPGTHTPNTAWDAVIGQNVPASNISGVGYSVISFPNWDSSLGINQGKQTMYTVGKDNASGNFATWGAAFDLFETMKLDEKVDDGIANTGIFRTRSDYAGHEITCTTGIQPNHSYDTSDPSGMCTPLFFFQE